MVNKLYIAAGDKMWIPVVYICQITPSPTHPQSRDARTLAFPFKTDTGSSQLLLTFAGESCLWRQTGRWNIHAWGPTARECFPRRIHSQEPGEFYDHGSKFEKLKKRCLSLGVLLLLGKYQRLLLFTWTHYNQFYFIVKVLRLPLIVWPLQGLVWLFVDRINIPNESISR